VTKKIKVVRQGRVSRVLRGYKVLVFPVINIIENISGHIEKKN